jgi:hypothetical protein
LLAVIGTRSRGFCSIRRRNSSATCVGVSEDGSWASSSFSRSLRLPSPLSAIARSSQWDGKGARGSLSARDSSYCPISARQASQVGPEVARTATV